MCLFRIHVLLIPYVTPRCIDRCNRVHRDLIKKLPCWDVHGTLINGSSMVKGYNQKILLTSGLKPCTIYVSLHDAQCTIILHPTNASPSYIFILQDFWDVESEGLWLELGLPIYILMFCLQYLVVSKNMAGNRDEHKHVFFKTAH